MAVMGRYRTGTSLSGSKPNTYRHLLSVKYHTGMSHIQMQITACAWLSENFCNSAITGACSSDQPTIHHNPLRPVGGAYRTH